jgi:hypothetical protein
MTMSLLTSLLLACSGADAPKDVPVSPAQSESDVSFELTPVGPDIATAQAFSGALHTLPEFVAYVQGHDVGQMRFELLLPDDPEAPSFVPTNRFVAVYWDYTANRAFEVKGDITATSGLTFGASNEKSPPTLDEFEEAKNIARAQDPALAAAVDAGTREFFRAMPPTIPNDQGHRVISLGIRDTGNTETGEIVGADLSNDVIIHFEDGTPPSSRVGGFVCNPPPSSGQAGSGRGNNGWARLRMMSGGREVWSFVVVRPSSSSGAQGSGVELTEVNFRGKRVLNRAHLPILNVQYDNNACGPYRDWQWSENPFEVGNILASVGRDIAVVDWAKTMRETRDDTGNFQGVAVFWDPIHQQGVVLSEIEAGWYRYVTEWRFGLDGTIEPRFGFDAVQNWCTCQTLDGTIEPRFGFDAVQNWCTCQTHFHHAYWRLDFNINGSRNRAERFDGASWSTIRTEAQQTRDDAAGVKWRVSNANTGDSYQIRTRPGEDAADTYGIADAWWLASHNNEITDDAAPPAPIGTQAGLPGYVGGENIFDADLVLWWGGHFRHDDANPALNQTHTVGLVLQPDQW